jgi:hypothetical protein
VQPIPWDSKDKEIFAMLDEICIANKQNPLTMSHHYTITIINRAQYEVSVMVKVGKYWKWPSREDKIFYHKDQIRNILQPPTLVNSREHYNFTDFI